MSKAKVLSTRLLEAAIIGLLVMYGTQLVLQADIGHIKESQQQQLEIYKELRGKVERNKESISDLRLEIYKHKHPKK